MEELITRTIVNMLTFLLFGIITLRIGYYSILSIRFMQKNGTKTKARIIKTFEEESEDGDIVSYTYNRSTKKIDYKKKKEKKSYLSIVKFTDTDGIETEQKIDLGLHSKKIDEYINIVYTKNKDEYDILIDKGLSKYVFTAIMILVGIIFSAVGIISVSNNLISIISKFLN